MKYDKEADLQKSCNAILRELEELGQLKWFHLEKGRSDKQKTHRKDIPDLIIWAKNLNCFFVELKADGGKPTKEQLKWSKDITALGYRCYWTDDLNRFQEILQIEGVYR